MKKTEFINDDINLLIISYLTESITEGDLVQLNKWISASNENRVYFNELKNSWILSGDRNEYSVTQAEESWKTLKNKLSDSRLGLGLSLRSQENFNFKKYLRLAATWLLFWVRISSILVDSGQTERDCEYYPEQNNRNIHTFRFKKHDKDAG